MLTELLPIIGGLIAGILGAWGVFTVRYYRSKAVYLTARGEAHGKHAAAEARELETRGGLDERTRVWADSLIAAHKAEVLELRGEMQRLALECREDRRLLEERHQAEMTELEARYVGQLARVEAELQTLRQENWALRLFLVRQGFDIGTGPLPELEQLERIPAPQRRSHL